MQGTATNRGARRRGVGMVRGLSSEAALAIVAGALALTPTAMVRASGEESGVVSPGTMPGGSKRGVAGAAMPIRSIVLYRSGVGYFERVGTVTGDQKVSLRFEAGQINDILKSMTLVELDPKAGGRVAGITYGSKEPLERRLKSFGVDVSDAPGIADLFMRLRGSEARVTTPEGEIGGTILGVESRATPTDEGRGTYPRPFVNLVTTGGVRSVPIDGILSFRLAKSELNEELNLALAALEEDRTERLKTVEIAYTGPEGVAREALVAYVSEAPVWKTSYRLVLPEEKAGSKGAGKVTMQGWAIVENTTEEDWEEVRLTLASGRPVSFTMDLYSPLFAFRPAVSAPVDAGVGPRVYEGGVATVENEAGVSKEFARLERSDVSADAVALQSQNKGMVISKSLSSAAASPRYDPAESMRSAAWGGEVGEQFVYAIEAPVTLARQRSAMLPILSAPITGRRVSIFNASEDPKRARRGVQMTNDSGLHLIPGPITVLDGSTYAGDAQIPHTARNEKRLLAYAVDLDVKASLASSTPSEVTHLKIARGMIEQTMKSRSLVEYAFENMDTSRGRTMLVEHPIVPGYDLVEPKKAAEKTDSLYRFEVPIEAGRSASLKVAEEAVTRQRVAMASYSMPTLVAYAAQGKVSKAVVEAVRKAAEMQGRIDDLERTLAGHEREREVIGTEQGRIRENMRTIGNTTDLYARYMAKLNEQESRLEKIEGLRAEAERARGLARGELGEFVTNLDIE